MNIKKTSEKVPQFDVETFEHALGHVSKAVGKLHGIVGDAEHICKVHGGGSYARSAFVQAETLSNPAHVYIADLVICAMKLAALCPSGAFDLEQAVTDRLAEKKDYLGQFAQ